MRTTRSELPRTTKFHTDSVAPTAKPKAKASAPPSAAAQYAKDSFSPAPAGYRYSTIPGMNNARALLASRGIAVGESAFKAFPGAQRMSWKDIALAAGITDFQGAKKDPRFLELQRSFYGHSDTYKGALQSVINDPKFAGIGVPLDKLANTSAAPSRPGVSNQRPAQRPQGEFGKTYVNEIGQNNAPRADFKDAVNAAIDRVMAAGTGFDPTNRERIADFPTYHAAVTAELQKAGFLARYDGEELAISRPGMNHSEQYDISTRNNQVRRFYSAWVSPSVFG